MEINNELMEYWKLEEQRSFSGWDFSSLKDRVEEEKLSWSYEDFIYGYLTPDSKLLDMGTGGGEFLMTLEHPFNKMSVTEGYPPNYELCLKNLKPLGIDVKYVAEDNKLDFWDNTFDIVINRHESFDLKEVKRVLKPGGIFITQQVGKDDIIDLSRMVLDMPAYENTDVYTLNEYLDKARKMDFEILDYDECHPKIKFNDVGALVYFAKVIEWQFPGFTVDNNSDSLKRIHQLIMNQGYISSKQHRFVMILKNK